MESCLMGNKKKCPYKSSEEANKAIFKTLGIKIPFKFVETAYLCATKPKKCPFKTVEEAAKASEKKFGVKVPQQFIDIAKNCM